MRASHLIIASSFLALAATAAQAKTEKFTFIGNDGTVYCDGITVTTTDNIHFSGIHTGSCETAQPADGFTVKIPGYVPVVNAQTSDAGAPTVSETVLFSAKVLGWEIWEDVSGVFTRINYGTLQKGVPPAAFGAKPASTRSTKAPVSHTGLHL